MPDDDLLGRVLLSVRGRRADVQADHDRIATELTKLRAAERSLASLVETAPAGVVHDGGGAPVEPPLAAEREAPSDAPTYAITTKAPPAPPARSGRRGPQGPRPNSAKSRLRALLVEAGQQGVMQDLIAKRLAHVSTPTLNAYLSGMVASGEAVHDGEVFRIAAEDGGVGTEEADAGPEADALDAPAVR